MPLTKAKRANQKAAPDHIHIDNISSDQGAICFGSYFDVRMSDYNVGHNVQALLVPSGCMRTVWREVVLNAWIVNCSTLSC